MVAAQNFFDDSIILLNKPCGHISHEITSYVKKLLGITKTGHAGTLDPNVSGVLPIALGRSTKLLQYVASKRKTYVGIIKFRNLLTRMQVEELFKKFTGKLTQTPPKISAVRKVPRKRTIYSLKLLEFEGRFGLFETEVDAGTYIRTLCEDIGKQCGGARMEELRRIAVGDINEKDTVTLSELIDAVWLWKNKNDNSLLMPMLRQTDSLISFRKVVLKQTAIRSVLQGAQVMVPAIKEFPQDLAKDEPVKLYSESGVFLGIGHAVLSGAELSDAHRGIAIRTERMQAMLSDFSKA